MQNGYFTGQVNVYKSVEQQFWDETQVAEKYKARSVNGGFSNFLLGGIYTNYLYQLTLEPKPN